MSRPAPTLTVDEHPGQRFADLSTAQRAAMPGLAEALADTLRALIASGALAVKDGRVIPTTEVPKPNA